MDDNKVIGKVSLMVVLILQALSASFIAGSGPLINNTAVQSMAVGRSLVFEFTGDHLSLQIGNPPKSFTFYADTGSDPIWVQCDEQCRGCNLAADDRYKPGEVYKVPRNDPLCSLVLGSKDAYKCDFDVNYAGGLSSRGYLVKDRFTWGSGSTPSAINLAFGCGNDIEIPNEVNFHAAGMLGLGQDVVSFPSQLRAAGVIAQNVIGHCLTEELGRGFLFIGDDHVPKTGVTWTPMSTTKEYYASGRVHFLLGQASVGPLEELAFDSGYARTYLPSKTYKRILEVVKGSVNPQKLIEERARKGPYGAYGACWKLRSETEFKHVSAVSRYFKALALRFENQAELVLLPKHYLEVTEPGLVCLAIFQNADIKDTRGKLGYISMQDKTVIYDNEKRRIGWKDGMCVPPTPRAEPFFTDM